MEVIESVLTIALICIVGVYGVAFITMAVSYVLGRWRGESFPEKETLRISRLGKPFEPWSLPLPLLVRLTMVSYRVALLAWIIAVPIVLAIFIYAWIT